MITLTNGVQIPENAVQLQTTAAIDGYYVTQPLRLVQYDETLPVAAVQLTYQNQPYTPPTGAELNIRMGKPDGTTVYNPCLGMDSSGIVYFAFTQQMTAAAGDGTLTVEITDSGVKNSAPIIAEIRPNPVPEGSIESADEFLTLQEILAEAEKWGQIVQTNAANIQQVVDNLEDIQNAAENAQAAAASAAAAQQAAQEALGFRKFYSAVVPDSNGNLDPSRPMTVGPAASVEIESKGDRIQSVTALGFTTQAGTGDPSPTNVRAITNGGLKLVKLVLTGTENWILNPGSGISASGSQRFQLGMSVTSSNASAYAVAVAYCSHFEGTTPSNTYGSNYDNTFSVQNADLQLRAAGISTVEGLKQFLAARYAAGDPVIVWYQPADESQATGLYAPIILTSGEYRATCLPLTAPLCEGDSVVSWVKSGCDKVVTFDGSEDEVWGDNTGGIFCTNAIQSDVERPTSNAVAAVVFGDTAVSAPITAVYAAKSGFGVNVNGVINIAISGVSSVSDLRSHLSANPLTIWYRSTNYTEASDIPVSLETHQRVVKQLNGAESWALRADFLPNLFIAPAVPGIASNDALNFCDTYKTVVTQWDKVGLDQIMVIKTGNYIGFRDDRYSTADEAKQGLSETPVTIVYQLATPLVYAHPAVIIEAATGDQLTYTVTGQSGGTVSVALKPFQDGGHAKTSDNATNAQNAENATQFDGHAWSEMPGQAPVQSVNGKTGAVTLSAADVKARPDSWTPTAAEVGAIPEDNAKTLASGITWGSGSTLTPEGWDDYAIIQLSSNYGRAIIRRLPKNGSTFALFASNTADYINITCVTVTRNSTGGSLALSILTSLRLSTSGITKNVTEFNIYQIDGLV